MIFHLVFHRDLAGGEWGADFRSGVDQRIRPPTNPGGVLFELHANAWSGLALLAFWADLLFSLRAEPHRLGRQRE
jgi:hypothetical protein